MYVAEEGWIVTRPISRTDLLATLGALSALTVFGWAVLMAAAVVASLGGA